MTPATEIRNGTGAGILIIALAGILLAMYGGRLAAWVMNSLYEFFIHHTPL